MTRTRPKRSGLQTPDISDAQCGKAGRRPGLFCALFLIGRSRGNRRRAYFLTVLTNIRAPAPGVPIASSTSHCLYAALRAAAIAADDAGPVAALAVLGDAALPPLLPPTGNYPQFGSIDRCMVFNCFSTRRRFGSFSIAAILFVPLYQLSNSSALISSSKIASATR